MTTELRCPECGTALIQTSERWLCCPHGHGKLVANPNAKSRKIAAEDNRFADKLAKVVPLLKTLQEAERAAVEREFGTAIVEQRKRPKAWRRKR